MPDFRLSSDRFPEGTSVAVYAANNKRDGAAPAGSSVTSGSISGGAVTFTGLQSDTPYVAYASVSGEHRYVGFRTSNRSGGAAAVPKTAQAPVITVDATVDLPSVGANTTSNVDVALPAGTCKAGDIVLGVNGFPALNHGLLIQQANIITDDSVRLRVSNVTAGALDAASVQASFAIARR